MFDRNSLVAQLGWRLGIVLSIGTLLQMAWLFMHFRGVETSHANAGLMCELLDFFKDVAWTTPVIGVATFVACAAGMRRHLEPLRKLSEQAARISPGNRHTALPIDQAPSEVQPLVTSVNTGFERLVEAVQVQRRFTANAAHELRTPAAVVQAGLEGLPSSDEVAWFFAVKRSAWDVLSGQLFSLARLEGPNGTSLEQLDAASCHSPGSRATGPSRVCGIMSRSHSKWSASRSWCWQRRKRSTKLPAISWRMRLAMPPRDLRSRLRSIATEPFASSTMARASRKQTGCTCSSVSGEGHGPCVQAADLAWPLSPRPVNALAQAYVALARPAVGRPSKFDCQ